MSYTDEFDLNNPPALSTAGGYPIIVSKTQPANPAAGTLWIDINYSPAHAQAWDGAKWVNLAGSVVSSQQAIPSGVTDNDMLVWSAAGHNWQAQGQYFGNQGNIIDLMHAKNGDILVYNRDNHEWHFVDPHTLISGGATLPAATADQILVFNGQANPPAWEAFDFERFTLNHLGDVSYQWTPAHGSVLTWDQTQQKWVDRLPATGGGVAPDGEVGGTLPDFPVAGHSYILNSVYNPNAQVHKRWDPIKFDFPFAGGTVAGETVRWDNAQQKWVLTAYYPAPVVHQGNTTGSATGKDQILYHSSVTSKWTYKDLDSVGWQPPTGKPNQVLTWDGPSHAWIAKDPAHGGGSGSSAPAGTLKQSIFGYVDRTIHTPDVMTQAKHTTVKDDLNVSLTAATLTLSEAGYYEIEIRASMSNETPVHTGHWAIEMSLIAAGATNGSLVSKNIGIAFATPIIPSQLVNVGHIVSGRLAFTLPDWATGKGLMYNFNLTNNYGGSPTAVSLDLADTQLIITKVA